MASKSIVQPIVSCTILTADELISSPDYMELIKTEICCILKARSYDEKFSFIRTLDPSDQALFVMNYVPLVCSEYDDRYQAYQSCIFGSITITDYITIMQAIAEHVSRRYKVYRKAYEGGICTWTNDRIALSFSKLHILTRWLRAC